ncbi:MAG: hypothetical protein QM757_34860 [Paludibaculum sp.]
MRAAVRRIDRDQPLFAIRTMPEIVAADAAQTEAGTGLMAAFAGLALILGALEDIGIVAYGVARRTRSLWRGAGCDAGQVQGNVMTSGALLALMGLAAGLAAALGLGRFLESSLPGAAQRSGDIHCHRRDVAGGEPDGLLDTGTAGCTDRSGRLATERITDSERCGWGPRFARQPVYRWPGSSVGRARP